MKRAKEQSKSTRTLAERIYQEIKSGKIKTKKELGQKKRILSDGLKITNLPTNPDLLQEIKHPLEKKQKELFSIKPIRNLSGISVLAAMVKPHVCPHGTCIYCPKGLHHPSPPAYTGDEPAAQRGYRNNFDAFKQVSTRIQQLQTTGQSTEKCELIIMGGTFLSMPKKYQNEFMLNCLNGISGKKQTSIEKAVSDCEKSKNRVIGITMETRPDTCTKEDIQRMLEWGTTRVELGVQTTYDDILEKLNRQHTIQETIESTQRLKESCLKVCYHMMSKLPYSTLKKDMQSHIEIFQNEKFKPDMVKFYPTTVVENTALYPLWKKGEYKEITLEEAIDFYSKLLPKIPEWVRVMRIQRDIPSQNISGGVKKTNLRQLVEERMKEEGKKCRDIRSREAGFKQINENKKTKKIEIVRRNYLASGGKEIFISAEDVEQDILVGFIRLRIPNKPLLEELENSAFIRELHVYGQSTPLGEQLDQSGQHKGWGKKLLEEAETIAQKEFGYDYMNIISGIGVREYYKKQGYKQNKTFVRKKLT